jgi:transcriptional regulator with XRE-family HTH domain
MASLGQDLKRERELRGISLQEIADSTRISLRFLQAVEEDRLDIIPGPFFVRAILRSYARNVGLDENQVLNRYQEKVMFEEQLEYQEARKRPSLPPRLPRFFTFSFSPLRKAAGSPRNPLSKLSPRRPLPLSPSPVPSFLRSRSSKSENRSTSIFLSSKTPGSGCRPTAGRSGTESRSRGNPSKSKPKKK